MLAVSTPQTRRQFLIAGLSLVSATALLPLLTGPATTAAAQTPEPIRVRVGEIVHQTRADFAAGQTERLDRPRAGGDEGGGLAAGPDGGVYTSDVLSTEFAASHVGLRWLAEGAPLAVELRTSRDGQRWSRWQSVQPEHGKEDRPGGQTCGALIGARGARFLQYRATFPAGVQASRLVRMTLTYLDARPNGAPSGGAEANASLLAGPADFRAQIVPREAWGADESLRFSPDGAEVWPRAYVPARKVVVHHTATANDYADGAAEVRAIYTYHTQTLGWGDIGYQLLIDNSGRVYEGRRGRERDPDGGPSREIASRDVVAGHATGFNYGSASIALIGNFQEAPLPTVMRERLEDALVFECGRHGIDPLGQSDYLLQTDLWRDAVPDLPGHRDCTPTECPGDYVYAQLTDLRRAVAQRLALDDLPRVGPVVLEQGRSPWPGRLSFAWSGLRGAEFSSFLEGWFRLPGHDEIVELSGYRPGTSLPAWGDWSRAVEAAFDIPPTAHGHYTLHVRTRTAPGVEGVVWSRATALVEPQVAADNADRTATTSEGDWPRATQPRQFYGSDYAHTPPGGAPDSFRWRLAAPRAGRYAVQASWVALDEPATAAPYTIAVEGRQLAAVEADQSANPGTWRTLTELDLPGGQIEVAVSSAASGTVVADAVRLLLVGG